LPPGFAIRTTCCPYRSADFTSFPFDADIDLAVRPSIDEDDPALIGRHGGYRCRQDQRHGERDDQDADASLHA
jgi:hypothetical protein